MLHVDNLEAAKTAEGVLLASCPLDFELQALWAPWRLLLQAWQHAQALSSSRIEVADNLAKLAVKGSAVRALKAAPINIGRASAGDWPSNACPVEHAAYPCWHQEAWTAVAPAVSCSPVIVAELTGISSAATVDCLEQSSSANTGKISCLKCVSRNVQTLHAFAAVAACCLVCLQFVSLGSETWSPRGDLQ